MYKQYGISVHFTLKIQKSEKITGIAKKKY